jgi:hypothetical protein
VWIGWYAPEVAAAVPESSPPLFDGAFYPQNPGPSCSGDPTLSVPMWGAAAPQQVITRTIKVFPPGVCRMGQPVCFALWVQQADNSWRASRAACSAIAPTMAS